MTSSEGPVPTTITRKTALIVLTISLPWILIFSYLEDTSRGLIAFGSSFVMISVIISYWSYRDKLWFLLSNGFFITAHLAFVLFIPDPKFQYSFFIVPLFILDFVIVSFAVGAIGDRLKR